MRLWQMSFLSWKQKRLEKNYSSVPRGIRIVRIIPPSAFIGYLGSLDTSQLFEAYEFFDETIS